MVPIFGPPCIQSSLWTDETRLSYNVFNLALLRNYSNYR